MSQIVIPSVTPAQVAAMVARLRANGGTVTDNGGVPLTYTIEDRHVKASAVFAAGVLTVTILDKPFYVDESDVETGLRKALAA